MKENYGFSISAQVSLDIHATDSFVSAPKLTVQDRLDTKNLLSKDPAGHRATRASLPEHIAYLTDRLTAPEAPFLILGLRNCVANLRAPLFIEAKVHAAVPEQPFMSKRPYFGIGSTARGIEFAQLNANDASEFNYFAAGYPLVWDDLSSDELQAIRLTEVADHAHIYNLPRGSHPLATDTSLAKFSQLNETFKQHIHHDFATAHTAMLEAVAKCGKLQQCDNYFHGVLGVRDNGQLIAYYAHDNLAVIEKSLRQRGCIRAICVENSGSIMPTFYPKGLDGESVPLTRAPNFRPNGQVVLALQLSDRAFTSMPVH